MSEQNHQNDSQVTSGQHRSLRHPLQFSSIIILLIAVGLGAWLWQSGAGNALTRLPIVESIQEGVAQSDNSSAEGEQPNVADDSTDDGATLTRQGRMNRGNGTGNMRGSDVAERRTNAATTDELPTGSLADNSQQLSSKSSMTNEEDATDFMPLDSLQLRTATSVVAVVGIDDVHLLNPDDGAVLETIQSGTPLKITKQSEDGEWFFADIGDLAGWVEAEAVLAFGTDNLSTEPLLISLESISVESIPAADEASSEPQQITGTDESLSVTIDNAPIQFASTTGTDSDSATLVQTDVTEEDAAEADATEAVVGTVTLVDSRLNVRSAPTTSSTIVAKAYPNEEFIVQTQDETGSWLRIALSESTFGWVSAAYVELSGLPEALPISMEISDLPAFSEANIVVTDVQEPTVPTDAANVVITGPTGLDGTLAFRASDGLIYGYNLETGDLWPITDGFDPAISPDGSMIAFTRDGGESGLYIANIDGSDERLVYGEKEMLSAPKWSVDGSQILFTYRTDVMESSGGRRRGGGTQTLEDLYNLAVIDINGENFTDVKALDTARAADWTNAGIVYQSSAGIQILDGLSDEESWSVAFNNLNPFDYDPDWQPNGGQIAFMKQGASHWEIYVVNPDGSGLEALTRPVTSLVDELPSNVAPVYSPNGDQIVYLSNRGSDNSAGPWQIWMMDSDGSNARPLPINVDIDYTFGSEQAVSWGI
ncbi:MAG: SH3 domain-containing protein [Chloroflexota bacterium]